MVGLDAAWEGGEDPPSRRGEGDERKTDVLDADRQLLVARNEVETTRADAARAAVHTFRALGGGWDVKANPSLASVK